MHVIYITERSEENSQPGSSRQEVTRTTALSSSVEWRSISERTCPKLEEDELQHKKTPPGSTPFSQAQFRVSGVILVLFVCQRRFFSVCQFLTSSSLCCFSTALYLSKLPWQSALLCKPANLCRIHPPLRSSSVSGSGARAPHQGACWEAQSLAK